jgi:16S rRNA (adenine1518-N6/adenine1519-N6)-dimethyltransferase
MKKSAPGHQARKRFGQNFLQDSGVIHRIIRAISPKTGEHLVEIGPGLGALTEELLAAAGELDVIELDKDLIPILRTQFFSYEERLRIHQGDALKFDFDSLCTDQRPLRVVGNLPYNISTPLLFHLLTFRKNVKDMHFMLQKEVVDRMAASPGNKSFGRLTVMLGCQLEVVPLFEVTPDAFTPPPKVMSSIVRMRPLPDGHFDIRDEVRLEQIVKQAFSRRRKTLRNALEGHADLAALEAAGLDPGLRPEQIPIIDWIKLANSLSREK